MFDTESTNPVEEVVTTNAATEADNSQAEGDDEGSAGTVRDAKGRFAKKGEAESDDLEQAEDGEVPDEAGDEFEELDIDGDRLAVPKHVAAKLKEYREAGLRQADYTRKTQEVSAQRKQYEELLAKHQQDVDSQKADFEEYAGLHALSKYLDQFKSIDWNKAMEEDPITANKQFIEWQTLNNQLQERAGKLQQKQHERALEAQRAAARREEEGREVLRQSIRDWSHQVESSLRAYAKEQGAHGADSFQFALNPQETKILHKAYLYDQLTKRAQAKPKAPDPKPVKTVGQNNRHDSGGLHPGLSDDEWVRRRLDQRMRRV